MMKKMSVAISAGVVLLASSLVLADGHGKFTKAWDEAEAARKAVGELGHEWTETKKLLKKAKDAHKDGKEEKAMKLVARALEQANDGIAQHKREASNWMARVPK